jgi:hypothetical protein
MNRSAGGCEAGAAALTVVAAAAGCADGIAAKEYSAGVEPPCVPMPAAAAAAAAPPRRSLLMRSVFATSAWCQQTRLNGAISRVLGTMTGRATDHPRSRQYYYDALMMRRAREQAGTAHH